MIRIPSVFMYAVYVRKPHARAFSRCGLHSENVRMQRSK